MLEFMRSSVQISSYELSKFAAALTQAVGLTRARGAPPRVEPLPSYGVSARGRLRSRLARGAALTQAVGLTRARGAPPREQTRRLLTNHPCQALSPKSPIPKERLRVSNWIVQRLYDYAVSKTVEL